MSRGNQVLRQWILLRTLQTRGEGTALRDLASDLGVTERTIQRDFEVLQELGFPIDHQEDEYGKRFWRMPHDFFRTGPLVLTLTEAISIHLADRLLMPLSGTHLAEGLRSILDKIRSLLPQEALEHFRQLDQILYVRRTGLTDYSGQADTIRVLIDAIREERTVEITYRALWRGEAYHTRLDPYGLVLYDADLFVLGHSHRARDLRLFKVARIAGASLSSTSFERPDGFELEEQFRASFGIVQADGETIDIRVRFTGSAAALVAERVWHESQRLIWQPGEETLFEEANEESDTLVATYRLSSVVEFKRWIKGFGCHAEVLSPKWLRQELGEELRQACDLYRHDLDGV